MLQGFVNACVRNPDCSQPVNEVGPEMLELVRRINRCEQGATAVEYGLILSLIVIAMLAALQSTGRSTGNMWGSISNKVVIATNGS
jgi:pilus assembly protein Flp/PilA